MAIRILVSLTMAGLLAATGSSAVYATGGAFANREADALTRCGVINAVKVSRQPGDPLVLAKTLPFICDREMEALKGAYMKELGRDRGSRIFKLARFNEMMIDLGTAIIVKERAR